MTWWVEAPALSYHFEHESCESGIITFSVCQVAQVIKPLYDSMGGSLSQKSPSYQVWCQ